MRAYHQIFSSRRESMMNGEQEITLQAPDGDIGSPTYFAMTSHNLSRQDLYNDTTANVLQTLKSQLMSPLR